MRTLAGSLSGIALTLSALAVPAQALAYDAHHVFITNRGGGNIVEFDEHFAYQRTWFEGAAFGGLQLSSPNGMAFTPEGALFVADTGNDRVVAFNASGGFVRAFSTSARLGSSVESIYFDAMGVLYASGNVGNGTVARFSQTGMNLPNVVHDAAFLGLTQAGTVIVSDFSGMHRGLRELDPTTGTVIRAFGTDLGHQEDVMIDGADRVFVTHYGAPMDSDEIVVFGPAPDRTELYRFRAPASAGLTLSDPTGIALTMNCEIIITSHRNSGIFIFHHEGESTPPTFVRVLRPGVDVPAAAMLGLLESVSISGIGLPGSFDEFAETVPSCDPIRIPDAGGLDASAAAFADAFSGPDSGTRSDAGRGRGTLSSGCGCHAGARDAAPAGFLAALGLALALRRRKTKR